MEREEKKRSMEVIQIDECEFIGGVCTVHDSDFYVPPFPWEFLKDEDINDEELTVFRR